MMADVATTAGELAAALKIIRAHANAALYVTTATPNTSQTLLAMRNGFLQSEMKEISEIATRFLGEESKRTPPPGTPAVSG